MVEQTVTKPQSRCPLSGTSEDWFVETIARGYRLKNYSISKNYPLHYGTVDLIAKSNQGDIEVIECKANGHVNAIAHALGQLLIYKAQFPEKQYRICKYIIQVRDCLKIRVYNFLKQICASYGVELYTCRHCENPRFKRMEA